jgi:tRNA threonylcarbamoyladenosine biosynthesis protein TsaB
MILLAIDTSEKSQGLALMRDGKILAEHHSSQPSSHAEELLNRLEDLLRAGSLSLDQIQGIALTVGPGSFTGLRIALATVKGLAWARNIPVIPVGTLLALAAPYLGDYPWVAPCMDARMGQVYAAVYGRPNSQVPKREIQKPQAMELNEFSQKISELPPGGIVVGSGLAAFPSPFPDVVQDPGASVQASWVARLGDEMYQRGKFLPAREITPAYLRLSTAEVRLLERSSLSAKKP